MLLGPPASGKGTQAELLREHLQIPAVSPGAILREEARLGTELGQKAASFTDQGRLVPDDLAVLVVEKWLAGHGDRFAFDGFPRSLGQARLTETMLTARGSGLDIVFFFEVDEAVSRDRILRRRICHQCGRVFSIGRQIADQNSPCPVCGAALSRRPDDDLKTLAIRMDEYRAQTLPLLDFYEQRELLVRLDGRPAPEDVFAVLRAHLT